MHHSRCPFCELEELRFPPNDAFAIEFPDAFPVADGHTLVVPIRHIASVFDLPEVEQAALWQLVAVVRARLADKLNPDGFNIGVNDGVAAGQTVTHAHIHVIPRWHGDVVDPRGGIRWVLPTMAQYWSKDDV